MTFTEAAVEVLRLAGKPLHYKEITELAVEKNLLSHVGKSPEVTMGARLAALLKKEDEANPIVRIRPGVFGLREWNGKAPGPAKPSATSTEEAAPSSAPDSDAETSVNALELEEQAAVLATEEPAPKEVPASAPSKQTLTLPKVREEADGEAPVVLAQDEALRADLAASGADLFDDEDDDDQPILGQSDTGDDANGEGGRRKRRRRRRGRGRGDDGTLAADSSPRLEDAEGERAERTERPRDGERTERTRDSERSRDGERTRDSERSRDGERNRQHYAQAEQNETHEEQVSGKELADAVLLSLGGLDRAQGPVSLRTIADQLSRRGKVSADSLLATAQVSAAVRADNLRRVAAGQRPRFRLASQGRVALTDWSLSQDLLKLEQDALIAVERYRDASRKLLLRRLQELPGHAFTELCLLALERLGMTQIRSVRRSGGTGGEAHFTAVHKTGTDDIRTAIIIRKDGREVGRERVADLRGSLHHYSAAQAGWLITTGQVLSGAREEAAALTTSPVALFDGLSFARLLEEHGVAVQRTQIVVSVPDLDLLETLRNA